MMNTIWGFTITIIGIINRYGNVKLYDNVAFAATVSAAIVS